MKVVFPINLSDINNSYALIIRDLNNLSIWSQATGLQFNFNKYVVLHYGANNPNFVHTVSGQSLPTANSALDLGVKSSTNLCYDEHCNNLIRRVNSTSAFILRTFTSRNVSFMSRTFVAYVRPILEYACQVWSPFTIDLINRAERVQRLFTKCNRSIAYLTYNECLTRLGSQRL